MSDINAVNLQSDEFSKKVIKTTTVLDNKVKNAYSNLEQLNDKDDEDVDFKDVAKNIEEQLGDVKVDVNDEDVDDELDKLFSSGIDETSVNANKHIIIKFINALAAPISYSFGLIGSLATFYQNLTPQSIAYRLVSKLTEKVLTSTVLRPALIQAGLGSVLSTVSSGKLAKDNLLVMLASTQISEQIMARTNTASVKLLMKSIGLKNYNQNLMIIIAEKTKGKFLGQAIKAYIEITPRMMKEIGLDSDEINNLRSTFDKLILERTMVNQVKLSSMAMNTLKNLLQTKKSILFKKPKLIKIGIIVFLISAIVTAAITFLKFIFKKLGFQVNNENLLENVQTLTEGIFSFVKNVFTQPIKKVKNFLLNYFLNILKSLHINLKTIAAYAKQIKSFWAGMVQTILIYLTNGVGMLSSYIMKQMF